MTTARLLACLLTLLSLSTVAAATESTPTPASASTPKPPTRHFLIVLRLVPRLHDEKSWTDADKAVVGQHFKRLQAAVATGQVLLAGRTEEPLEKTFGLVVFSAADEAAAREFMLGDPCIAQGVMTGTLHPYGLALRAK